VLAWKVGKFAIAFHVVPLVTQTHPGANNVALRPTGFQLLPICVTAEPRVTKSGVVASVMFPTTIVFVAPVGTKNPRLPGQISSMLRQDARFPRNTQSGVPVESTMIPLPDYVPAYRHLFGDRVAVNPMGFAHLDEWRSASWITFPVIDTRLAWRTYVACRCMDVGKV
jgi:hypothetical protein